MTTFLSSDPKMYEAYNNGKDLYAMIAQSAFDNEYGQNLEFWPAGSEVEVDGKKIVSGSGKERLETTDDNDSISVKYYELLDTEAGEKAAQDITENDFVMSSIGKLKIINISKNDDIITFTFSK